jgi:hypothetical protein
MTHDPFQTIPTSGSYPGMMGSAGLPYAAPQTSAINPAFALNPLAAALGISALASAGGASQLGQHAYPGLAAQGGLGPQQQLAPAFQQATIPQLQGLSALATGFQNPLLASVFSNPLALAALQNPAVNSILAALVSSSPQWGWQQQQQYPQFGQNNSPFGQAGLTFGQQPAVGFGQFGSSYGQPGLPFSQFASPFALAPQSWVGQGGQYGGGQQFGQIHPLLSQLGGRPFPAPGISPWGY